MWYARVAGLVVLMGLGGCRGIARPTQTGGTTGSGSSPSASALVGAWQRTLILQTTDDITTSRTTWVFAPDGACQRTLETTSVAAGFTQTTVTGCAWRAQGAQVFVLYEGSSGEVAFTWSVFGNVLTLSGQEFRRA